MHEVTRSEHANNSAPDRTDAVPVRPLTAHDFAACYPTYLTPLYRYFSSHVGNIADAEDLTATVIAKAVRSIGGYAGSGTLGAWLFGIARHTLRDHQRQHRTVTTLADFAPFLADTRPLPEQQVMRQEQADHLYAHIAALPASQREALTLRYFAELPLTEIAQVMDRSEGAVKLLIHRALTTLRNQYRSEAPQ